MAEQICTYCKTEGAFSSGHPLRFPLCSKCQSGVYAIVDSLLGDVVYVGSSVEMSRRWRAHFDGSTHLGKSQWLRQGDAELRVLETAPADKLPTVEQAWTRKLLADGHSLRWCVHGKASDISGQRFGRWRVERQIGEGAMSQSYWRCHCDCGTVRDVIYANLTSGASRSCGCRRWDK